MVILEQLQGVVPDGAIDLARLIDADLLWFGDDLLTADAFLAGPEWALQRERARIALDFMGLQQDDRNLLADGPAASTDTETA